MVTDKWLVQQDRACTSHVQYSDGSGGIECVCMGVGGLGGGVDALPDS